ncbi:CubicO group peptidase (beta-lactamase class C family) [Edaphobacter lichenicola]|uniref:CubicO group peptidase (Beta-lactamase class C family) n=1 Tax=Tunturiibacter lichenicola TaxID=2051959 RepID=A0A7W8J8Q5_9BACT|nr:CubicO group peptidase (beta-lactamase class C family) [Edaphobacter lichenicola]
MMLGPRLECQTVQHLKQEILDVENGLTPPIRVAGQPPAHKSLVREMQELHVPAVSVVVIHNGAIEWAKGYGVVCPGGARVTPETLFQAASISKSLTAMAALHLVETGSLSLDAPIQTELKNWTVPQNKFTMQHPVTLRELLSHTAGTTVHGFAGYAAGSQVPTLLQVLNGQKPANSDPVVVNATPGEGYSYSGGGFIIVQQTLMDTANEPFATLMKKTVLDPIGMHHSNYQHPLNIALLPKVARPVDGNGKPIEGGPHTYPEMAAAGLWTTPTDLALWIIEMQHSLAGRANHVLSTEMTRTMLTPVKSDYGLGVGLQATAGKKSFSHSGGNEGYRAFYIGYEDGDGAVVMTSGNNGGNLMMDLIRSVAQVYGWPDFRVVEHAAIDLPASLQASYIGKFAAKNILDFSIRNQGSRLQLEQKGEGPQPLFASAPALLFTTASQMLIRFDSFDRGALIFGKDEYPFERIK